MNLKVGIDYLLYLLSVPKCVGCNEKLDFGEKAFCPKCSADFEEIKTRNCSRCAKVLSECSCTTHFLSTHFIKGVFKCYRYDIRDENRPANALIYSLKRDNRDDVLQKCTDELCKAIQNSITPDESFIITNVPRRRKAVIEYGIDHSALLAKSIAKRFKIQYLNLLESKTKREQKTLTFEERLKNIDFELLSNSSLKGKNVIIVDDIITTGASLSVASSLIRSLGPKNIYGASLAIVYKDDM